MILDIALGIVLGVVLINLLPAAFGLFIVFIFNLFKD
jgi:hypothetical protein